MASYTLEAIATDANFDETGYLLANPDVAKAVQKWEVRSGRKHFEIFGKNEGRKIRFSPSIISDAKQRKLERIKPLLRTDLPSVKTSICYDFLSEELRTQFNIIDTDAVSSNGYDPYALEIIEKNTDGLVLDCGAGSRRGCGR